MQIFIMIYSLSSAGLITGISVKDNNSNNYSNNDLVLKEQLPSLGQGVSFRTSHGKMQSVVACLWQACE